MIESIILIVVVGFIVKNFFKTSNKQGNDGEKKQSTLFKTLNNFEESLNTSKYTKPKDLSQIQEKNIILNEQQAQIKKEEIVDHQESKCDLQEKNAYEFDFETQELTSLEKAFVFSEILAKPVSKR